MSLSESNTLVMIPEGALTKLLKMEEDISDIKISIKNQSHKSQVREWIPRLEFMERVNIGSTQFNILKNRGKLRLKDVGRKKYVHASCIDDYFAGKIK